MIRKENGVWTYPSGREVCKTHTAEGQREYKHRTEVARIRQDCRCALCKRFMAFGSATLDHEEPRGFGGANRDDRMTHDDGSWRNAALCMGCNGEKGSKRYCWLDGHYVPNYGKQSVYETPDCEEPWSSNSSPAK